MIKVRVRSVLPNMQLGLQQKALAMRCAGHIQPACVSSYSSLSIHVSI